MHEILKTLQIPPPEITVKNIQEIALRKFGFVGATKSLGGERDQNFLIRQDNNTQASILLKVANPSEPDALLDLQCKALAHIHRQDPALPVPEVIKTTDGENWASIITDDGDQFRIRAFDYLPGLPLYEAPADARLLRNLGRISGRLNLALRGFFHPAASHALAWDTQSIDRLSTLLENIRNHEIRTIIQVFLDQFATLVKPKLPSCRGQIIHNDLSFHNSVVEPKSPTEIAGIFDFGDMIYAPLIQDIALSAAEFAAGLRDPVASSAEIVAGFHEVMPLEDEEFELLPDMIAGRLALCLLIDAWSQQQNSWQDARVHLDGWNEKVIEMLQSIQKLKPGDYQTILKSACGLTATVQSTKSTKASDTAWIRRQHYLGNADYFAYDKALHLVKGEGVWLYDMSGKPYLDAYNNVPHTGHCHPRVVTAIARQTALLNTNTRYLYDALPDYAERLADTLPPGLDVCYFVSSGSEANDLAWRMARAWSGNSGGLVMENAYHGITEVTVDLSPAEKNFTGATSPHIAEIKAPDDFRGNWKRDNPDRSVHYAQYCADAIAELEQHGHRPAAFFMDMILSTSGILTPPPGYTADVFQQVRAAGGLCIADEVQSGFGRLGTAMWGFERESVIPDIVTLGKPIAAGYPMGLVVTTRNIANKFNQSWEFFSTTGGNPVACAAATAVLEVMQKEQLMENACRMGEQLGNGIRQLQKQYPIIGDVRGAGLFIGVELILDRETLKPAAKETIAIANTLKDDGVLIGIDGIYLNVLKIRPPMVFNQHNVIFLLDRLENALGKISYRA